MFLMLEHDFMVDKIIRKLFSIIKNEEYVLDSKIAFVYLFRYISEKFISLLRGLFIFQHKYVFCGKYVKVKVKNKIKFEKWLNVGNNVFIDALSTGGIAFGKNCSIGKYTCIECTGSLKYLGKGLVVGDNVGLGTHSFYGCAGGIDIGDDVIIGNYVSMHSENHNFADRGTLIRLQGVNHKGIKIGNNCWIGAKATILDGTTIGNGCVVAAGAVVIGCFPNDVVIGGVPAKVLKER
jgi:acetyltransferase-like isoleucine patch superfamily enzyme